MNQNGPSIITSETQMAPSYLPSYNEAITGIPTAPPIASDSEPVVILTQPVQLQDIPRFSEIQQQEPESEEDKRKQRKEKCCDWCCFCCFYDRYYYNDWFCFCFPVHNPHSQSNCDYDCCNVCCCDASSCECGDCDCECGDCGGCDCDCGGCDCDCGGCDIS